MPKSVRSKDPRELARVRVDRCLEKLAELLCGSGAEIGSEADDRTTAAAVFSKGMRQTYSCAQFEALERIIGNSMPAGAGASYYDLAAAREEAGFLVGLELGRRLGGAR
jgi:hypothetical protein